MNSPDTRFPHFNDIEMLKLRATVLILFIFVPILVNSLRVFAQTAIIHDLSEIKLSDKPTVFMDPKVWDADSLYKRQAKWNQHHEDENILVRSRHKRSTASSTGDRMADVCQSKMEVITPYYATNSQGKRRKIVNSQLLQQAIQVETCSRSAPSNSAPRCNAQTDCRCEQKYKWHRLLVLDPDDAGKSRGLFMDWFLFPSSCVCRCSQSTSKQFLRAIKRTDTT